MASKVESKNELVESVSKALSEIQANASKDMATELAGLSIANAKEVIVGNKKAIVVFVPYRQHKKFQKVQGRLIREFEKKFSGAHVVILAQRTILSEAGCKSKGITRPRSRTLTAVHSAILNDLVFPTQIVGQRTRFRTDQSKLLKVYLDPKDTKEVEEKLKTFSGVYSKLTNRSVEFLFPTEE